MEVVVCYVVIRSILQKIVDYEREVASTAQLYWAQVTKLVRTKTIFTFSSVKLQHLIEGKEKKSDLDAYFTLNLVLSQSM